MLRNIIIYREKISKKPYAAAAEPAKDAEGNIDIPFCFIYIVLTENLNEGVWWNGRHASLRN